MAAPPAAHRHVTTPHCHSAAPAACVSGWPLPVPPRAQSHRAPGRQPWPPRRRTHPVTPCSRARADASMTHFREGFHGLSGTPRSPPRQGELFLHPGQGTGLPGRFAGGNQQRRFLARHGLSVQVVQLSTAKGQMRGEQKSKRGIFLFFKASCQRRSRPFL